MSVPLRNVLYLTAQFGRGGSERQLAQFANRFRASGVQTSIVCLFPYLPELGLHQFDTPGTEVFRPDRRRGRVLALGEVLRFARRQRPQIVHSFNLSTNLFAWLMARVCGAAAIGGLRHEYRESDLGRVRSRLNLRYPPVLLCNSSAAADSVRGVRGWWAPRKIVEIPNGVDLTRFPEAARHGTSAVIRLIGIGNLHQLKRWEWAIRAVPWLQQHGCQVTLTICGSGRVDNRRRLEELVSSLGIADVVSLPGNVGDVEQRLANCDVMVHCSYTESAPNALSEGMCAGLACVVTAVGEIPRIVHDGENGMIVARDDEDGFREKLLRLCQDAALRARLGTAARTFAFREFSIERRIEQARELYASVLASRAGIAPPDAKMTH